MSICKQNYKLDGVYKLGSYNRQEKLVVTPFTLFPAYGHLREKKTKLMGAHMQYFGIKLVVTPFTLGKSLFHP
jgi:hypothetical protein